MQLYNDLEKFLYKQTNRRPVVLPVVMEVNQNRHRAMQKKNEAKADTSNKKPGHVKQDTKTSVKTNKKTRKNTEVKSKKEEKKDYLLRKMKRRKITKAQSKI